jgi:hypothetical protein
MADDPFVRVAVPEADVDQFDARFDLLLDPHHREVFLRGSQHDIGEPIQRKP